MRDRHHRHPAGSSVWPVALAGALAGVLASRLLPPLLAEAAGRTTGADPFDRLACDHRAILDLLHKMEEATGTAARATLLFRLKRRMAAHALAEEDIVYPLLRARAGAAEAAQHLYAEHAEMKMHLHALEELVPADGEWAFQVRALRELIARHVREEEQEEFPRLRRHLDDAGMAALAGKVRREKAMIL